MRTPIVLLAALVACAPPADTGLALDFPSVLPEPFEAGALAAPTAPDFQLVVGNLVAGARNNISVSGAPPNTLVLLGYSPRGVGEGICPPSLQGACLGLRSPVTPLPFTLVTSAAGTASINLRLPASLAGANVGMQAAISGPGGGVSNAVGRLVLPAGTTVAPNADADGDGFTVSQGDCNDFNGQIAPFAPDTVGDGLDLNCDDSDGVDDDGDAAASVASGGDDCDDTDSAVRPDQVETCDGVDSDCNGLVDDGACGLTEQFSVGAGLPADLLFVVDDSCSMFDEQGRLAQSGPTLINTLDAAGVDAHIGVVTTDMNDPAKSGALQPVGGMRFLDTLSSSASALIADFSAVVSVGTGGNVNEQGRAAAAAALTPPLVTGTNVGFYRDSADFHLVFVSDENDYSGVSPTRSDFIAQLSGLKATGLQTRVHTIVGPAGGCPTADAGSEYLAVGSAIGGFSESICSPDFDGIIADIADEIVTRGAPAASAYVLAGTPDPTTIVVEVALPGIGTVVLQTSDYVYDPQTRTLTITGVTVPGGSTITVTYDQ